ncbi:MAG: FtsH protease activity modulator HflK [Kiritimatiellaeota bacterium]|nr:FtsH protease activity modulator HflK [Kiritimatiellota bacterium]
MSEIERHDNPWDDIRRAFGHLKPTVLVPIAALVLGAVYLGTGVYIVNPGEQGVVKRFGRVIATVDEGAHYRLPWPVDTVEVVNVSKVRRADIGMVLPEHEHPAFLPEKLQLLTGDENLINVEAIIHYKIKDPARFLYRTNFGEERLLHNAVGSALVELIGQMAVDDILTTEKISAQARILRKAQKVLDEYESGLQISAFNIRAIVPPEDVADAFRDVQTAKEDREQVINQARGFANSILPEARGRAREWTSEAEGYRTEVVNRAEGDAQNFEAVLAEYQNDARMYSEDITRYRLYLETMEKILPRVKKYVLRARAGGEKVNLRFVNRE